MKNYLLGFAFVILGFSFSGFTPIEDEANKNQDNNCITCHIEEDMMPEGFFESDVHMVAEIGCEGCHGGDSTSDDPDEAMSTKNGFVGVPDRDEIPSFCGKCHSNIDYMRIYRPRIQTDQEEQYYSSLHGQELKKGNPDVAECASCHTSHSILNAKDPRSTTFAMNIPETCNNCHGDSKMMEKYGVDFHAYDDYAKSVHGIALLEKQDIGSPACNDCHGNHGAAPPGVASVSHVCGTCHVNNAEFFTHSKMGQAFTEMDFHGCEQCHGNHLIEETFDEMVGVGENSKCIECHEEGEKGYEAAQNLSALLGELITYRDSAQLRMNEAINKDMDVFDIEYLMKDVHQSLITSRTLVHTFDTAKVGVKTREGVKIAKEALSLSEAQISEFFTRRNGLTFATFIFIFIAIIIYYRVRVMEEKE